MANERVTEDIVREHFKKYRNLGVYIEEQTSQNSVISACLKGASKSGVGRGYPEFIVSNIPDNPNLLIIVECKASLKQHESDSGDKAKEYAVDGVLHYAEFLKKSFDVLAIAVSGEDKNNINISHYLVQKSKHPVAIFGNTLLSVDDYVGGVNKEEAKQKEKYDELLVYASDLNEHLHSLKIKEDKRSILLSGILIALKNPPFKKSYKMYGKAKDLADFLYGTIRRELKTQNLQLDKMNILLRGYGFVTEHESLIKQNSSGVRLRQLIDTIDDKINGYARTFEFYDFLGQFYIEFLKYSNADKGLGIVLTPKHITEFMADVIHINQDDVVLDNCTGTGGFLISAMHKMLRQVKGDTEKEKHIKDNQLYGIEFQDEIYPLAVSNMYLHGDGKSNILHGDCFDQAVTERLQQNLGVKKFTKGFLNPPYKSKKTDTHEIEFILNNLNMLNAGGKCVAIIPMSCVLAQQGIELALKKKLLQNHTLEAVFSMPIELFANSKVSVATSIIVLTAGQKHPENYKTFFGYYRDDGYEKRKTMGRADYHGKWHTVKDNWLILFQNKTEKDGLSITKVVSADDEWCAEAYMKTDYTALTQSDFEKSIRDFVAFKVSNNWET